MFLLVPAYPGCPGSKAVKRSLLLLLLLLVTEALSDSVEFIGAIQMKLKHVYLSIYSVNGSRHTTSQ